VEKLAIKPSKGKVMKVSKIISLIFVSFISIQALLAQQPLTLYYLENVPQTMSVNPAMVPRANGYLGFPGISSLYLGINTDLLGSEWFQEYNGEPILPLRAEYDFKQLYNRLGKAGNMSVYLNYSPIQFGFSGKKGYFSFSWTERVSQSIAIPKDFFTLVDNGLPKNKALDFSPLAINAQYYRELSFGYSYKVMSKLRVGVHVKLLQGLGAAKTDLSTFSLKSDTSSLDIGLKGTVYVSAPIDVYTDENGIPDSIGNFDSSMDNIIQKGVLNFSNPGLAADIGVVYEHNLAWTFSASLNDLGFIKWTGDVKSYTADGSYSSEGIELNGDQLNSDSINAQVEQIIDTLKSKVNLKQGTESFSTGLGPKLYVGARYNVNHYLSLGALSRTSFVKNDFQQEFNVSANLNLYHVLTTSINYTFALNGANSLGLGLALRGGPVQFYLAMDYIPLVWRPYKFINTETDDNGNTSEKELAKIPIAPQSIDNFNLVFGFNYLFGPNGFRDEPMIDAYEEF